MNFSGKMVGIFWEIKDPKFLSLDSETFLLGFSGDFQVFFVIVFYCCANGGCLFSRKNKSSALLLANRITFRLCLDSLFYLGLIILCFTTACEK